VRLISTSCIQLTPTAGPNNTAYFPREPCSGSQTAGDVLGGPLYTWIRTIKNDLKVLEVTAKDVDDKKQLQTEANGAVFMP